MADIVDTEAEQELRAIEREYINFLDDDVSWIFVFKRRI